MKTPQKITATKITILGYGKMAAALARGLAKNYALEIAGRNGEKIQQFIAENGLENAEPCEICGDFEVGGKIVIFALKPHALGAFSFQGEAAAVFSVMAGVLVETLQGAIKAQSYCRAMPNLACLALSGVSAIYAPDSRGDSPLDSRKNSGVSGVKKLAGEIFGALGECVFVEKEAQINAATALSGGAPAYLAIVAEALIDAGLREGLSLADSRRLVMASFRGFGAIGGEMSAIRQGTTSPGGTTIEAVFALEKAGIRGIFMEAIHQAHKKARAIERAGLKAARKTGRIQKIAAPAAQENPNI